MFYIFYEIEIAILFTLDSGILIALQNYLALYTGSSDFLIYNSYYLLLYSIVMMASYFYVTYYISFCF